MIFFNIFVCCYFISSSFANHCNPKLQSFQVVQQLIVKRYDVRFTNVVKFNHYSSATNCLAFVNTQDNLLNKLLAVIYNETLQSCFAILATNIYGNNNNVDINGYFVATKGDRIYLSDEYEATLDTVKVNVTFQQRLFGNISFDKSYNWYRNGFGDIPYGDFWIGLNEIRSLTEMKSLRIRFEMQKFGEDVWYFSDYSNFQVGPASDNFRLSISGFDNEVSTAGDSMITTISHLNLNNQQFKAAGDGCVNTRSGGAFWFNGCGYASPNAASTTERLDGAGIDPTWLYPYINWYTCDDFYSLKAFRIMLFV